LYCGVTQRKKIKTPERGLYKNLPGFAHHKQNEQII